MTIGKYGHDYSIGPNLDFIALIKCHAELCAELSLNPEDVHVSMGMSNDYDRAVGVILFIILFDDIHYAFLLTNHLFVLLFFFFVGSTFSFLCDVKQTKKMYRLKWAAQLYV